MKYIDVHCHIDQYTEGELREIFAPNNRVSRIIGAAMNKASGDKLLKMKEIYPQLCICLGIHPEYPQYYDEFEKVKDQIIKNKEIISAIGEIGLPYYSLDNKSYQEKVIYIQRSKELLIKFLDLAQELELPVVLHAIEDTAKIALEELKKRDIKKALFHWFEGEIEVMQEIVKKGYYISISPDVLYNKAYSEFVRQIPMEHIVLESDGPWEYNGKRGKPSMTADIVHYLSIKRNEREVEIIELIYNNSRELFNI